MNGSFCENCERGRTARKPCGNKKFDGCDFKKTDRFQDGICVNCGKVAKSRDVVLKKLKEQINLYPDNVELFMDLDEIVIENDMRLTDSEIRSVCDYYFKRAKQTKERLTQADELFQVLHRSNQTLEVIG